MRDGLEIVREISLKDVLENRVAECDQNPRCPQKRIVLVVWDAQDQAADALGEVLSQNTDTQWLRLHSKEDMGRQFQEKVDMYQRKASQREVECPRCYLLFLYHQNRFWETFPYVEILKDTLHSFSEFKVEYCRLMEERFLKCSKEAVEEDKETQDIQHFEWRIEKTDKMTAELLLQRAKYDEELLSAIVKSDFVGADRVAVKTTECSAVREEFSKKFEKGIEKQTSGEADVKNRLRERLLPGENIKEEIPDFTWLPLVGYERLEADLKKEMRAYSLFDRILIWFKRESVRSERSLRKILGQLFGGNGYEEIRSEQLRKKLETEIIPKACRDLIEREKGAIREKVFAHFSLYDIIYTLPELALQFRDESEKASQKADTEIKKILDERFYFQGTDIAKVYPKLEPYFEKCRRFLQRRVEYSWWDSLAVYLQTLKREVDSDYRALCVAATVLKNSRIPQLKEALAFEQDYPAADDRRILNEEELRQKIQMTVSSAKFERKDLIKIVKAMEKYFESLKDLDSNLERKPRIYMLLSQTYGLDESEKNEITDGAGRTFQWRLTDSEFLSEKKIFQLRVYSLYKGE